MLTTVDVRELPARLGEVLEIVCSGSEVLLTDGVTPCARLVPCSKPGPRLPGLHAGEILTAGDFDAALPDEFWAGQK